MTAEPWHIDEPAERALLDRLAERWPTLESVLDGKPARGVVTGCNRAFVLDRQARDALLATDPAAAPLVRPFVKGRDIRRWLPEHADRWILLVDRGTSLDELPGVLAHLTQFREGLEPRPRDWHGAWRGRKPGPYLWHELQDPVSELAASTTPRLMYQDIQTGPACSLVRDGLVPDTTVWILPTDDRFLLALLNSPLYGWFARRRFPPALNGAVRPKLEYIRTLPIARGNPEQHAAVERLVGERIELEPRVREKDATAARTARDLDAAIDATLLDIYELDARERALVLAG